ncbi:hypothetical protein DLJ58_25250, partial [Micromonospora arida]
PDRTSRLDGINQKDIAGIPAASRETVARVLRRLRKLHVAKTGCSDAAPIVSAVVPPNRASYSRGCR